MYTYSVIVPIYNTSKYLEKCIESIVAQSYSNIEIILVDDGSTDCSLSICNRYATNDRRIQVYHQGNSGSSVARNTGISKATSDYLIFLDSDDSWPDHELIKKIDDRLMQTHADVLSINYQKVYSNKRSRAVLYLKDMPMIQNEDNECEFMNNHHIWIACAWNKIVKRQLICEHNLFFEPGVTAEDIDWCARLLIASHRFDYANHIGVDYLQRSSSVSKGMTYQKVLNLKNNIEKSIQYIDRIELSSKRYLLNSYIGYQVGTLLYAIAQLQQINERSIFIKESASLIHWLKCSNHYKIRSIKALVSIFDVEHVINLLNLRIIVKAFINRLR